MAKRPEGLERERWLDERGKVWRRRNWILNGLMLVVIVALYVRNCV